MWTTGKTDLRYYVFIVNLKLYITFYIEYQKIALLRHPKFLKTVQVSCKKKNFYVSLSYIYVTK